MSKISERSEQERPSERWEDHEWFKDRKTILEEKKWDNPKPIEEVNREEKLNEREHLDLEEMEREFDRILDRSNKRIDEIFAKFIPEKSKEGSIYETHQRNNKELV